MLRLHWFSPTCELSVARVLFLILLFSGLTSAESTLYTLNTSGSSGSLWSVNLQTGSASQTVFDALGAGSWNGLAASPVDANVLYAINNPRPASLDEPSFSRLVQIDLNTGESLQFPLFDNDILGSSSIVSSGIAISSQEPNVAIIAGNGTGFPPNPYLYRVDLATGEVIEAAKSLANVRRIESLTFSPDGAKLFGTNQDGELVTIDPQTAVVSVIGDAGLTNFLTGLAFEPNDASLFAIDGLRSDQLVHLDASTGALIDIIGPLGIGGPEGLAFVTVVTDPLDCTGDGLLNVSDLACSNANDTTQELLLRLNLLEGDFDGANGVDFGDFLTLATNYGQPFERYIDGDIDDNGHVEFADFLRLATNYGRSSDALVSAVPEPCGWPVALCPILASVIAVRSQLIRQRRVR